MNDDDIRPYTLDVTASERMPGRFEWAIRRNGKLLERSDRYAESKQAAEKAGLKAVERLFSPEPSRGR